MALALYRTYRPGTLAELVGQSHVTEPLARALDAGSAHHAYLLSGPRGCGKTSTARILARSLNCSQGVSSKPCGECRSCIELAPNGPGSIDVVEMDAATHRGIDDARDLRDRAIFAPAASPFRIYIIDEAHQLTKEASNALLKLIEEPPAHLRFIFATTEPEKIIPTIRSRTFHYGFRLVPRRILTDHLASVCRSESAQAEAAALALVARAGAGSVRDSLSVLGQLLAGAGPEGLTHDEAVRALGLTDSRLLADFVSAVAEGSTARLFGIVEEVINSGHDPRRFIADVLDRIRDLILLRADPEAIASGLIDVTDETAESLVTQVNDLGQKQLSRIADLLSAGLSEMKGATAPRLQLELLCARIALPAETVDLRDFLVRLERLERQHGASEGKPQSRLEPIQPKAPVRSIPAANRAERLTAAPPVPPALGPSSIPALAPTTPPPSAAVPGEIGKLLREGKPGGRDPAAESLDPVVAGWSAVLESLAAASRVAWTAFHGARAISLTDGVLAVAVSEAGALLAISQRGHDERLRQSLIEVLGLDVRVDVVHDPEATHRATTQVRVAAESQGLTTSVARAEGASTVRASIRTPEPDQAPDTPSEDDPDVQGTDGVALIQRELGARPIGQIEHA